VNPYLWYLNSRVLTISAGETVVHYQKMVIYLLSLVLSLRAI